MDESTEIPPVIEEEIDTQEAALRKLEQNNWKNELEDTIGFVGNSENAAHLMRKYVEGMREAYEIRKEQGKVEDEVTIPNVELGIRNASDHEGNRLIVKLSDLNRDSKEDPKQSQTLSRDDEIAFVGTVEDRYLLMGGEELTHSLDSHRTEEDLPSERIPYIPNNQANKISDYDSSDMEYRALGIQVLIAKRKNMPAETQKSQNERLGRAIKKRQEIFPPKK